MRILIAAIALGAVATPAAAQQAPAVGQRVDRLEREMRAVQRKVFPGAAGQQIFEPELTREVAPPPADGPSSSAVGDLTARVTSLEQELLRLTGMAEQNDLKLRAMEQQLTRFRGDAEFRLNALEGGGAPAAGGATGAAVPLLPPPLPGTARPVADPAPVEAEVATPASGDPGEDAYLAGYRLWEQKKFVEAQAALKAVAAKYPSHKRASYTQNLLGRAYLDEGKPAQAAEIFYANYQKLPRGDRAPDSLYYLGQSLMSLKPPKPADACKVYDELLDVYGATLNSTLRARVASARTTAKCG